MHANDRTHLRAAQALAYEELTATGSDLSLKLSVLLPLTVDRVQNIFCFDHELDRHDEWSRALVIERTV